MPKRPSLKKDFAETAFSVFQQATGDAPKGEPRPENPEARARGREGGLKGGVARAESLTDKKKAAIAKKAAGARWGK